MIVGKPNTCTDDAWARVGMTVWRYDDPRHTGRIESLRNGTARVRWHDNNWLSDEDVADLRCWYHNNGETS